MDDRLRIVVGSGFNLASSRRIYVEIHLVSPEGHALGKPLRTRQSNKTSNPTWDQELIFPSTGFAGFVLRVWEHHTLFPDRFLGTKTIQFPESALQRGGELIDDTFPLATRTSRDVVSGKIHLKVTYGNPTKSKPAVKLQPVEALKDVDSPTPTGRHKPLRVSSKWGLNKSIDNHQGAFVVVDEDSLSDSDHSPTKDDSGSDRDSSNKQPKATSSSSSNEKDKSPTDKKPKKSGMDEEIDWNGTGGAKKGGRKNLTVGKRGSGSAMVASTDSDGEVIDWNGTKDSKGVKKPKKTGTSLSSCKVMKIREQIAEVLRLCTQDGTIVIDCKKDDAENLTFSLLDPNKGTLQPVTLIIPESVRTGEFLLFTEDGAIELGAPGTIFRAMEKALSKYASEHEIKDYVPKFPTDVETPNSDSETVEPIRSTKKAGRKALVESFQDVDVSFIGGSSLSDTTSNIIRFTEEFQNLHGKPAFGMCKKSGKSYLRFAFRPDSFLSDLMAEVWLIDNTQAIVIELELNPSSSGAPPVVVFQSLTVDLNTPDPSINAFGLRWYLQKRLERYLSNNWPPNANNHLFLDIITYAVDKIGSCTKNCVICDTPLAFEMLKPSICDSQLCLFSSEQYGLGQDVSAMLQHSPEVFDLLISATYSITTKALQSAGDAKRFSPFPTAIEIVTGSEVHNFMDGAVPCYRAINSALAALPSVAEMAVFPNSAALRQHLDQKNPLSFPLLRWILTSNRTHLAKLKQHEFLKEIPSEHQYLMLSATPARERIFQERKRQYGSFMAFHGSGFFNWHAILRTGLRNLSGTDLMSTGAVYGNGIYLAAESSTSIDYAGEFSGWHFSMHAASGENLRCMALCEVINAGYKANPYYVVPKEEDIVTRYLCIFDSKATSAMKSAPVQASNIQITKSQFDALHTDIKR